MSIRFRDEDDDSTRNAILGAVAGAVAGFALGMFVSKRFGGIDGIAAAIRRHTSGLTTPTPHAADDEHETDDFSDLEEDELEGEDYDGALEERVLSVFQNDPILSERAVDIGALGDGIIELSGWVESGIEAEHAVTVARGVPEVDTVVNRLAIGSDERRFEESARRVAEGDPSLTETHWDGHTVGTGKRRQGRSNEVDRHADPKVNLQERWTTAEHGLADAADSTAGIAERRQRAKAARGVPKADHVDSVAPE